MADKKISALTAASTPLAGTEVLPIVQSGATVKVAVSDLTAGRTVSANKISVSYSSALVDPFSVANSATGGKTWLFGDGTGATAGTFGFYNANDAVVSLLLRPAGDVQVQTGNIIPGTAAKGINFTANTPAAGMTSQLLNWYEEGTWTPTLKGDGTAGTYQTAVAYGHYTRVGRLVTLHCAITLAAVVTGGGTGDIIITGLPYAKAANTSSSPGSADGVFTSVPMFVSFSTRGSSSTLYVFDTTRALIPVSQATANKNIDFVVTYIV